MPRRLIAAFTAALASDKPVQRAHCDVPHTHLVTQEQRGPQAEQLAAAHEARLKAIRTATRKTRHKAALTTHPPAPVTAPAIPAIGRTR